MLAMLAKKEAAARHRPIAHGPDTGAERVGDRHPEARRQSETRLQATVVGERKHDADDPCADLPCTD